MVEILVEEALQRAGAFGPFQLRAFATFAYLHLLSVLQIFTITFVGRTPQWRCEESQTAPSSLNLPSESLAQRCDLFQDGQCTPVYSEGYTSIVTEWDLVCQWSSLPMATQSMYFVGFLVSSSVCGWLSDTYGRRRVFLYSCVLFPVVTLASGLAPSYLMYVFTRFLVGAAYAGTLTYYVLNSEIVGTEYRSRIVVLGSASFPAGYLMLAVCAYYITGWRHLTVFSALSLATSLIGWRFIPESPYWLLVQGKEEAAKNQIMNIARTNRRSIPTFTLGIPTGGHISPNVLEIFRHPVLRRRTVVLMCTWFTCCVMYYVLTFAVGDLHSNIFISFSLSGVVEIPSSIAAYFSIERIGRKWSTIGTLLLGGASCLAITSIQILSSSDDTGWIELPLLLTGKLGLSATFSILFIYNNELFPTNVRTLGFGLSNFGARVGGILSPLVLLLDQRIRGSSMFLMGVAGIGTAFLCLSLPETLNTPLPSTLRDVKD